MILHVEGAAPHRRVERGSLWHRPADQHAVYLEPEVVVEVTGPMPLDHETATRHSTGTRRFTGRPVATRFGRQVEITFPLVLLEAHVEFSVVVRPGMGPERRPKAREPPREPARVSP